MINPSDRSLFTPVKHPESGVTIYVLTKKVAPVQQSFYFTNDGISADGRYLWFYCAFPPSGTAAVGRTLGVLDFQTGEIRHFPETQFGEASPWVEPETGNVYWQYDRIVWRRGPQAGDVVERVNAVPDDLIGGRRVLRTATHLSRSADKKELFVDLGLELQWLFGSLPLAGGDFRLWHRFDRLHDHALFSPTDADLVLFAEEGHADPITGLIFPITDRLNLIRRGEKPRKILKKPAWCTHEWWDPLGKHVWCCNRKEAWRVGIEDAQIERIVFPHNCNHAHASADGRLIVCDDFLEPFRGAPTRVHFLNRRTGRELTLVDNPKHDNHTGRLYHIDPHPRFCCGDRYVAFTTTALGAVDLAIVETHKLLQATT